MPENYQKVVKAVDPQNYQKFIRPITSAEITDLTIENVDIKDAAITNAKIADGTIARVKLLEGLGKYGAANQLLSFMFSPSDTSNSTTSTTYTQLFPRSIFIDFDELIKISGMQLLQRFIADIRTNDAAVAAWVRITNEPFAGGTPAGATRAEFSTTSTTFTAFWSDWWDVTDWTGKHEYNISFKTGGAATAYLDASFLQMAYRLV